MPITLRYIKFDAERKTRSWKTNYLYTVCEAGRYKNEVFECVDCTVNTISKAGDESCSQCPGGTVSNADMTLCGKPTSDITQ